MLRFQSSCTQFLRPVIRIHNRGMNWWSRQSLSEYLWLTFIVLLLCTAPHAFLTYSMSFKLDTVAALSVANAISALIHVAKYWSLGGSRCAHPIFTGEMSGRTRQPFTHHHHRQSGCHLRWQLRATRTLPSLTKIEQERRVWIEARSRILVWRGHPEQRRQRFQHRRWWCMNHQQRPRYWKC